jgi:hypothetical protein
MGRDRTKLVVFRGRRTGIVHVRRLRQNALYLERKSTVLEVLASSLDGEAS